MIAAHRFEPSGRRLDGALRPHTRGQRPELCAACDQPRLDPRHKSPAPSGRWVADRPAGTYSARKPAAVPAVPSIARKAGRRFDYQAVPWQLRMLALALDQALAAGPDVIGWRVAIRAGDCRAAIDVLPAELGRLGEPLADRAEPAPDDPQPAQDRQRDPVPVPADVTATRSVRARARQLTRAIRNDRIRALAVRAVILGASASYAKASGHLVLTGGPLTSPLRLSTTSDGGGRAWLNARADAKRKGLDVDGL